MKIVLYVIFILSTISISACTEGGYYYTPPVYDGYVASVSPKKLPEIKDNDEVKIP